MAERPGIARDDAGPSGDPDVIHDDDGTPPLRTRSGDERIPGWREVMAVAAAIVVGVLALAVLTSILPTGLQEIVFRTPLAIAVLLVVTVGLLARLGRGSAG